MSLSNIRSNGEKRCARCGIPITPANDSGWERFISANVTQPVCAWCDAEMSQEQTLEPLPIDDNEKDTR